MKKLAILLLLVFVSGCATLDPTSRRTSESVGIPGKERGVIFEPIPETAVTEPSSKTDTEAEKLNRRLNQIISDSPVSTRQQIFTDTMLEEGEDQDVSFSFYDADLVEVIRVFMQLLEEDYMVHPDVSGRVNLFVKDTFNEEQLVDLLMGVLRVNNVAMMKSDATWEFLPQSKVPRHISADRIIIPDTDEHPKRGQIIQGFRLNFIAASEMINIIEPYLSQSAQVYAHESKGVLLVSDFPHALERVSELIAVFDESIFADIKAKVFPLQYINAEDAAEQLEDISKEFGLEMDDVGRQSRVSFLPLERLNMVLTVTRNEQVLDFVEAWIEGLDQEVPDHIIGKDQENIYVYYVQYGDADQIVESLRGVFDEGVEVDEDRPRQRPEEPESPEEERPDASGASLGAVSGELSGPVRFNIDEATNSIITRCTSGDYPSILSVIEKLDLYPKQVLIEMVIAEVRLSDSSKMGVDWEYILSFGRHGDGLVGFRAGEDALPGSGGIFRAESSRRLTAALRASVDEDHLQILSTPTLLASDNKPALINIGDEVPYPTSTREYDDEGRDTRIDTTIQYRDTGIILEVTPKINRHGMVRMDIRQEVSSLTDRRVEGITAPVINTRHAETSLAVDDQETIVIAGLMEQERHRGRSGVPGLRRVPGLNYLFGTRSDSYENTELLVFITPHVIMSREDSSFLTRSFKNRLNELREEFAF